MKGRTSAAFTALSLLLVLLHPIIGLLLSLLSLLTRSNLVVVLVSDLPTEVYKEQPVGPPSRFLCVCA